MKKYTICLLIGFLFLVSGCSKSNGDIFSEYKSEYQQELTLELNYFKEKIKDDKLTLEKLTNEYDKSINVLNELSAKYIIEIGENNTEYFNKIKEYNKNESAKITVEFMNKSLELDGVDLKIDVDTYLNTDWEKLDNELKNIEKEHQEEVKKLKENIKNK